MQLAYSAVAGGQKGPPSAPPAVPPIIINPFSYHTPRPAIDPHVTPARPPLLPPGQPAIRACAPR
ncbi:MAG TPA: hypothetical protein VGD30_11385 [Telluria sp.]